MNLKYRQIARFAALLITTSVISGCGGVTLSPVKRAPLQISGYQSNLRPDEHKLLVKFESVIPDQPLADTVWDNVTGPFVDTIESKQIGFTQDYGRLVKGTAVAGMVGGMAAGMSPDYTRIVIPFGRIFEGEFHSGLTQTFPRSIACMTENKCEEAAPSVFNPQYNVTLKILEFRVWENPTNHLNLIAKIECKSTKIDSGEKREFVYLANRHLDKQSIGSVLSTSQGFIQEMNMMANRFASELAEDILSNLQKEIVN